MLFRGLKAAVVDFMEVLDADYSGWDWGGI